MKGFESQEADRWWPENLGDSPNSAGGQNGARYAYFASSDRLAVDEGNGKVNVYDTDGHKMSGVRQRQSGDAKTWVFTSDKGDVDLASLKKI